MSSKQQQKLLNALKSSKKLANDELIAGLNQRDVQRGADYLIWE
jgi:NAD-dependent DNA ligase